MRVLALLAMVLIPASLCAAEDPRRVNDVLGECGCVIPGMPADLLATFAVDPVSLKDDQGFVVAYHTSLDNVREPLHVIAGNASTGRWKHVGLQHPDGDDSAYNSGTLVAVTRQRGFILIAGANAGTFHPTSILKPDLSRVGATPGRVIAALPNQLFLYEQPLPRVTPTSYAALRVLDVKTGIDAAAFTSQPYDPVRRRRIAADATRYASLGREWCMAHNHHCDPALFESFFWDNAAVVNDMTNAVAFGVTYKSAVEDGRGEDVLAVCTGIRKVATIHCHESPLADWMRAWPGLSRTQLLGRAAAAAPDTVRR
jgi:hypothetical protein